MRSGKQELRANIKRFWLLAWVVIVSSCNADRQSDPNTDIRLGPPVVYTVNYPLAYFAVRIAGDSVNVILPAPPEVDPATWSPSAEQVAAYQQADLILLNGAGYAEWIQRVSLSQSRLVDTSASFQESLIPVAGEVTHSHGPGGDHSHEGTAFTTWLDLEFAIAQAQAVFDALILLQPDSEAEFHENRAMLQQDLTELDKRLREVSARIGDSPLLFSHPVYQYLIRRYGLNGYSVHWEPQELPAEEEWRELSSLLSQHPATWMIWEDEPHPDTVSRLERMGVGSLVFRPCANRPEEGNLLSVMRENVRALEQAVTQPTDRLRDIH